MCIEIVGVIQALRSQGKSLDFELIYLCLSWVWPEDICTVKASFNAHTAQAFADFPARPCYAEPTTGPEQLPRDGGTCSENQTILKLQVLKLAQVTPFVGSQKFPNADEKRRKIRKSDAYQCHQQVKLTAFKHTSANLK